MSGIYKTGIVKTSTFNDSTIALLNPSKSASITPYAATANVCLNTDVTGFKKGKTYGIEFFIAWSGFKTKAASDFGAWFQGTANESWSYGNPMTASLNNYYKPKNAILSSTSGSYHYRTSFINTNSEIKNLRLGFRSDNSNGKGIVTISDVIIVPEKYYISDEVKTRLADNYVSCDEIIEL